MFKIEKSRDKDPAAETKEEEQRILKEKPHGEPSPGEYWNQVDIPMTGLETTWPDVTLHI